MLVTLKDPFRGLIFSKTTERGVLHRNLKQAANESLTLSILKIMDQVKK